MLPAMLRTPLAVIGIIVATLVVGLALLCAAPFSGEQARRLARLWCRCVLGCCGVRLTVRGGESVQPGASYVFVSNHQSHLDAPSIYLVLRRPVRYVAKESLLRIPVFGWAARAIGTIPIDRSDAAEARQRLQQAEARLPPGDSVLFFAEGTRSEDGRLQPFKRGGAVMALNLRLPIVPIAVRGTRAILPKGLHAIHAGPVRVDIGEPIPIDGFTTEQRAELTDLVHGRVAELLERP